MSLGLLLLGALGGGALAQDVGLAAVLGLRTPLVDLADPLPYQGPNPPMGAARLDLMPGLLVHTPFGWEVEARARLSGYAMAWADETVVPAHRGAVEVAVRRFVPPHDSRTEQGFWEGGYAGGTLATEMWGRHPLGAPQLGSLHAVVGFMGLLGGATPGYLEIGYGLWGDRSEQVGGHGAAVRVGAYFPRPLRGAGAIPERGHTDRN